MTKTSKAKSERTSTRGSLRRSLLMKKKITESFASQVAAFIKRYRPALEALARK